jgi:DNA-binding NtrC family response regulator
VSAPRCLIVDDNEPFALVLAELMRLDGVSATVAVSAAEALGLLERSRFDVLVTDLLMPKMNGVALLREARRADPGLPAIAVTAYADGETWQAAQREGFLAIFDKLVPAEQLTASVRAARHGAMVAVVEDDALIADNLSDAVAQRGFTVLRARTAADTDRLHRFALCAALVDLSLPDSPRGEVLGQLSSGFPEVPLLVMTGHHELAQAAGLRRFYAKPFELHDMIEELEGVYRARAPQPLGAI